MSSSKRQTRDAGDFHPVKTGDTVALTNRLSTASSKPSFARSTTSHRFTSTTGKQHEVKVPTVVEDAKELALRAQTRVWLLKHGCPLPVGRLTKKQAHEIKECFEVLDSDHSGTLDVDELKAAFTMLGFKVSKESVQKIMAVADIDKTGLLEFDEFQSVMARSLTAGDSIAAGLPMPAGAVLAFEDVVRTARRRQMLMDVLKGGIDRQRVIDASSDFTVTRHSQDILDEQKAYKAQSNAAPLARSGCSYYKKAAQAARQAALELQAALDAASSDPSSTQEASSGEGNHDDERQRVVRLLTPDTEKLLTECLEVAGPIEQWPEMLQTHSRQLEPVTAHDLAQELLGMGVSEDVFEKTCTGALATLRPHASIDFMSYNFRGTWRPQKGKYSPAPYEMSSTYKPACSKGWLPPICSVEEPLQLEDSFDLSYVITTRMRNSLKITS
ncbi:hypothetical protein WJX73_003341 [Symbiochloris irregularis]|uniref:EF-hand domain-containing protein n=1 Tax=Symbiochloris irregularis TaxID=706552 RepID=A0AAW1NSK5_9CHLO